MNKQIAMALGVIMLLLLGTVAWAQGGQGRRGQGPGADGERGRMREHVAFGEIISISASELVIAPQIPEEMASRMQEHGRELPELPDSESISLSEETRFVLGEGQASWSDFQAGDIVVVIKDRDGIARTVADRESAKQFLQERRGERGGFGQDGPGQRRGQQFGEGGGEGPGGPGGPGGERRPPAMGSITAISADSITIKPMIPEEMQQRMQEHGRELPELPESLSWSIDDRTRYVTLDGQSDANPFSVGDVVVVLGPPEEGSAKAIVSQEAAREHMQQRRGEGGQGQGRGQGQDRGRGKGGKRGGKGGQR